MDAKVDNFLTDGENNGWITVLTLKDRQTVPGLLSLLFVRTLPPAFYLAIPAFRLSSLIGSC